MLTIAGVVFIYITPVGMYTCLRYPYCIYILVGTYLCICVRFTLKPYRSGVCTARRWHRVPNQNSVIPLYRIPDVCMCV